MKNHSGKLKFSIKNYCQICFNNWIFQLFYNKFSIWILNHYLEIDKIFDEIQIWKLDLTFWRFNLEIFGIKKSKISFSILGYAGRSIHIPFLLLKEKFKYFQFPKLPQLPSKIKDEFIFVYPGKFLINFSDTMKYSAINQFYAAYQGKITYWNFEAHFFNSASDLHLYDFFY